MQKRVHRNTLYLVIPVALFGLSLLLLSWSIIRLNLPRSVVSAWPWKLQLLDVPSATTAATITGGLILARAQYANAVRPMIGWSGKTVEAAGHSDKLVWLVRLVNGSTTPAFFRAEDYCVILKTPCGTGSIAENPHWITRDDAIEFFYAVGLQYKLDYDLKYLGPAFPLSLSSRESMLALFTPKAMRVIDDVLIRVRARDLAGDTHERIIFCMRGAVREPSQPDHPID